MDTKYNSSRIVQEPPVIQLLWIKQFSIVRTRLTTYFPLLKNQESMTLSLSWQNKIRFKTLLWLSTPTIQLAWFNSIRDEFKILYTSSKLSIETDITTILKCSKTSCQTYFLRSKLKTMNFKILCKDQTLLKNKHLILESKKESQYLIRFLLFKMMSLRVIHIKRTWMIMWWVNKPASLTWKSVFLSLALSKTPKRNKSSLLYLILFLHLFKETIIMSKMPMMTVS